MSKGTVTVKDVLGKIRSDRTSFELFGITPRASLKYGLLVRAISDAILAQAGIERGNGRPHPDMVLGPVAESHFEKLEAWVDKNV